MRQKKRMVSLVLIKIVTVIGSKHIVVYYFAQQQEFLKGIKNVQVLQKAYPN